MPAAKIFTKDDVLRAMRFTRSNRAAAKYLGCSYQHYKPYAKMRVFAPVIVRGEEEQGTRLWEFGKEIYQQFLESSC